MDLFDFDYRKLGAFTYHVLTRPADIRSLLMHWIMLEWNQDHEQNPDEHWTVEWLSLLPRMEFTLQTVELPAIRPRPDLLHHKTDSYSFMHELNERADEREEAMLRGVSIEPLLVNAHGMELMDGYTRHNVLQRYRQSHAYAYLGTAP
jgi:hypothetical protein